MSSTRCEHESRLLASGGPVVRCSPGMIEILNMPALYSHASGLSDFVDTLRRLPCLESVVIESQEQGVRAQIKVPLACRLPDVLRTIADYLRQHASANALNQSQLGGRGGPQPSALQLSGLASGEPQLNQPSIGRKTLVDLVEKLPQVAVRKVKYAVYLSLAGASLAMSIVGVIVPGIPTVPFLLLTSYFLVISSPRLNEKLLNSRSFGPLIHDWQRYRGMRLGVKLWIAAFAFTTVGLTLLLSEPPLWLLVVMFVMTSLSLYYIMKVPTVQPERRNFTSTFVADLAATS